MRKLLTCLTGMLLCFAATAQLKSPEEFLGYALGTHYTPHFKIVNYFNYVAAQMPQRIKLQQIGETNEGRPLLLATIASADNLQNIETIRINNLRLANCVKDKMAANENAPAIVWLSYNVHGNETSSSEAAMLTLYELLRPGNNKAAAWLQNTVVIIDPCLNPDGRDRYVNWFMQNTGIKPDVSTGAREHYEPWPRGRSNHYYFDMNRDWAWQTQVETQARLKKYNEWLPQVHVDFHEQGFNEPYYFAPAAEPFHEVITPWQREFQTIIGRNHAKYFDANGWLYFTKERFDLFYPSYGDTYPTYNGAIGMTYEQGGISAGLGVVTEDGDTLTLKDRIMHHFTTGISTVEITSLNAVKVVKEFRNYFNNAVNKPVGEFKSYVIKNDGTDRIERLKKLLDNNKINWSYVNNNTALSGNNYATGKTVNFKTNSGDIVINTNQPKSNLIKVLFERTSKLNDSATYDITAWSMPFVYGLNAYGLNNFVNAVSKTNTVVAAPAWQSNAYAYAVKWSGLNSAKFLAAILKKEIRVRYAEQGFNIGKEVFDKGSLLITRAANNNIADLSALIQKAAADNEVQVYAVASGFVDKGFDLGSDKVRMIQQPKVALLTGENISSLGVGEIWHFFEQQLGYPISLVNEKNFLRNSNSYNTLIIADGYYDLLTNKDDADELKAWVRRGGKLIAVENAVAQLARGEWGIKLKGTDDKKEETKKDDYTLLRRYENRERDWLVNSTPGAIFNIELDNSHPLAFGYPANYYLLKQDTNVYEYLKEGWNVGYLKKDNYLSGFAGSIAKTKLKDGVLIGAMETGRGQVIFFADNPLFRSFWENGKLLFCNAVFMAGQ
jgi:Zinc carboxypeptidase